MQLITDALLSMAFERAENETAEQFNQQTCSMVNKEGASECPICFFTKRVKAHLAQLAKSPAVLVGTDTCIDCGGALEPIVLKSTSIIGLESSQFARKCQQCGNIVVSVGQ